MSAGLSQQLQTPDEETPCDTTPLDPRNSLEDRPRTRYIDQYVGVPIDVSSGRLLFLGCALLSCLAVLPFVRPSSHGEAPTSARHAVQLQAVPATARQTGVGDPAAAAAAFQGAVQQAATTAVTAVQQAMPERAAEAPTCVEDGADCRSGTACCGSFSTCYVKNEYWASCNATCAAVDEDGVAWSCATYSATSAAAAPQASVAQPAAQPATQPAAQPAAQPAQPAEQAPAVAPAAQPAAPSQECSWEGENCHKTGCCRRAGFKCFEQDDFWASCSDTCERLTALSEKSWSCAVLGGDQGVVELEASATPAGDSLFCFSVVTPQGVVPPGVEEGYEKEVMDFQVQNKVGIAACDAYAVYQGVRVSTGSWRSVVNTDIFNKIWHQVQSDGKYLSYDFTVKADVDAVFFPSRLKMHIASMKPPANTAVYFHNINFKFHFMGALEVLSQQAVTQFLANADECGKHLGHNGGEDFFTMQCLDAIRVGHMTDFSLLDDKYTHDKGWHLFDIDPCTDESFVAFHPYKALNSWAGCHKVATGVNKPEDFVSCVHRWHGDACSLSGTRDHIGTDSQPSDGIVGH